eukprot:g15548.t1
MFGGGKKKLEELEQELQSTQDKLKAATSTIETKTSEITKLKADEKTRAGELKKQRDDFDKLKKERESLDSEKKKLTTTVQSKEKALKEYRCKLVERRLEEAAKKHKEEAGDLARTKKEELLKRDAQIAELEGAKQALEDAKGKLEENKLELERNIEKKNQIIQNQDEDNASAKFFLDVSLDSCEFAKPFPYFITVALADDVGGDLTQDGGGARQISTRKTEVSPCTQYPSFDNSSFLLPFHDENTESDLILDCYVVVNPEQGPDAQIVKKLGQAVVSLAELGALKSERQDPTLMELRQRTIVQNCSFLRKSEKGGSDGGMILVGKCLLRIEKKLLKPSEELKVELQNPTAVTDVERVKDKTLVEQLDQGLWLVTPFQHRLRVLCHCAKNVLYQHGGSSSSTSSNTRGGGSSGEEDPRVIVTTRILRFDGTIAFEAVSSEFSPHALNEGTTNPRGAGGGGGTTTMGSSDPGRGAGVEYPSPPKVFSEKQKAARRAATTPGAIGGDVGDEDRDANGDHAGGGPAAGRSQNLSFLHQDSTASAAPPARQHRLQFTDSLLLNQELVLPLPSTSSSFHQAGSLQHGGSSSSSSIDRSSFSLRDSRCEIAVSVVTERQVREILCVQFFLNVLPAFDPVTLWCIWWDQVGQGQGVNKLKSPELCVTVTREIPLPDVAETYHGLEFRCHGVPAARPLPEMANKGLLVVSPDFPATSELAMPAPRITLVRYDYDGARELTSVLEGYFKQNLATFPRPPKYFMTPVAAERSRSPSFDQYVIRCCAESNPSSRGTNSSPLEHLSLFLFEQNLLRSAPESESLIPDFLLGFASVDVSTLTPPEGARDPLHRAYMLDLKLLEDPTRPAALAVDVRVWGRNIRAEQLAQSLQLGVGSRFVSPQKSIRTFAGAGESPPQPGRSVKLLDDERERQMLLGVGGGHHHQQHQEQEFKLNQDLSVQLMREFNLRASALKSAGEEIRQAKRKTTSEDEILENENAKLQAQLDEELRFNEEVRVGSIGSLNTELLDSLSTQELAVKLQTTVQRYREEKQKVQDLKLRMESGMREIVKNRGLEKKLTDLEKTHLEQSALLQKYQKDNKKISVYRETAKSQEQVIGKLEKVLETSLEDLHKAQQTQIDLEKARQENFALKEELDRAGKKQVRCEEIEAEIRELRGKLADRETEYEKLRQICEQLEG